MNNDHIHADSTNTIDNINNGSNDSAMTHDTDLATDTMTTLNKSGGGSIASKFIAINIEDLPDGCVGRAVFWVSSGAIPYQPVVDALTAAGFGDDDEANLIPSKVTPMVALRRAMDAVSRSHNSNGQPAFYVQPLSVGKKRRNRTGWLIAQQQSESDLTAGGVAATVNLVCHTEMQEQDGEQTLQFTFDPPDHPYIEEIEAKYEYYLSHLAAEDVSVFLANRVARSKLFAMVPLRPSGGFYYLAPQVVPIWECFTQAFTSASNARFHHINVLSTEKSMVEATLAGITEMFNARMEDLTAELQKEPGLRKLNNATDEVAEMLRIAASHEAVLGGFLGDVREKADRLTTTLRMMIAQQELERPIKKVNNEKVDDDQPTLLS